MENFDWQVPGVKYADLGAGIEQIVAEANILLFVFSLLHSTEIMPQMHSLCTCPNATSHKAASSMQCKKINSRNLNTLKGQKLHK